MAARCYSSSRTLLLELPRAAARALLLELRALLLELPRAAARVSASYSLISAMTSPYSVSPTGVKPTRSKNACGPPSPAS